MPHDDFISNDLVNMRERLRRNYEERQRAAMPAQSATEPSTELTADAKADAVPLPVLRKQDVPDTETMRECRELEGRLLRDLAASRFLTESLSKCVEENEKFHAVATAELEELQRALKANCSKEQLAFWRAEYMSASGRWNASCGMETRRANPENPASFSGLSGKYWWLLSAAVLVSAFVVAGTLVALWG